MKRFFYICTPLRYKSERKRPGEVTEWSNVPVLKTGVPKGTGGSNPSFTAGKRQQETVAFLCFLRFNSSFK